MQGGEDDQANLDEDNRFLWGMKDAVMLEIPTFLPRLKFYMFSKKKFKFILFPSILNVQKPFKSQKRERGRSGCVHFPHDFCTNYDQIFVENTMRISHL